MRRSLLASALLSVLISSAIATAGDADSGSKSGGLTPILGNYPDKSLPLSTNTTIAPDVAPMNTTTINVSTSTNFKGRLEGNPATGVIRVTDAHPAGTYTVTVTAFDDDGVRASKAFILTVTTPATCAPLSFAAARFYVVGNEPESIAVGDFNGDGYQDLALVGYLSNNVTILLGNGDGTFGISGTFSCASNPRSVAVGDFNGDGNQDLAVTNLNSNNVSILLGNGDGTFSGPTNFTVGHSPDQIAVGDFNGDEKQDLVVINDSNISILLGNGDGTFGAPTNFDSGGLDPYSVAIGDFNGDGYQDLAVTNSASNRVSILLGDGTGHFSVPTSFAVGNDPFAVVVGDFNGDGYQDLAVANSAASSMSVLLGDGTGHFSIATNFNAGADPNWLAVGDFDGDGNQDLVVANVGLHVSILLGDGAGRFSAPNQFTAGSSESVAVGDFNGDGKQDIAVVNGESLSILLRDCALTPTSVVSRMTHGSAGTFDINLPVTGSAGIECRRTGGTNDYTLIATFGNAVTVNGNPQARVTLGAGTVGSSGMSNGGRVTISGNTVTIPLTNVANAQTINVTLFSVNNSEDVVITMGVLVADVNGNGAVNAGDVAFANGHLGQAVDATNFRADVNVNGVINATDVCIIKSNLGTGLP